ncbi:MAG TPA: hypothetical protein VFN10_03865 [Thermoanaerobaculia bacterium]|nr:hypothetical protein [Thermoanaerobaculia bacterium]
MTRAARRLALLSLCLGLIAPLFAAAPPSTHLRGETLYVTLPADLIAHKDVRRQLTSGLTTTFAIVASAEEAKQSAGIRIDVRYEPWDEVFFVTTRTVGTAPKTQRIASLALLEAWWRETSLPVLSHASGIASVQLTVEVLPFSVEEQQETQRWLTRSLGERPLADGAAGTDTSVVDALFGTSIKRRPILRYKWQLQVKP